MAFSGIFIVLLFSVYSDITSSKIRNKYILCGWICAFVCNFADGLLKAFTISSQESLINSFIIAIKPVGNMMINIIITLVIGYLLYQLKAFGAGDIKLFSVIAGMYGLEITMFTFILMLMMAGLAGIIKKIITKAEINKIILAPFTMLSFLMVFIFKINILIRMIEWR